MLAVLLLALGGYLCYHSVRTMEAVRKVRRANRQR